MDENEIGTALKALSAQLPRTPQSLLEKTIQAVCRAKADRKLRPEPNAVSHFGANAPPAVKPAKNKEKKL